jgi:AcrB/AcrD/AcrF family
MALGGLALAFSRLIDNSVVVLENIHRHMELGEPPVVAAEKGGREVALPVLAATLTTIVVFFLAVSCSVSANLVPDGALTLMTNCPASVCGKNESPSSGNWRQCITHTFSTGDQHRSARVRSRKQSRPPRFDRPRRAEPFTVVLRRVCLA